ncbi:hypothetical protein FB192DRAFT_1404195 [Mucor lusitanicus]|uniref:Chromatin target of PRMT1 protein C-terminal domain-containing protein n=1 Tax=Mucor circinelloides f. lusitanicus TaxID=29924 RepID=A0A8H4B6U6_MUCCL|nr:hypothetical protein FB192DRAFT_1404195 [Mucor lusitanicus]
MWLFIQKGLERKKWPQSRLLCFVTDAISSFFQQKRMSYNNRRNQSSSTSTRTVSYNSGGLNERFSKIVKSAVAQRMPTAAVSNTTSTGGGSVFSRLRGPKTTPRGKPGSTNIQNRLGKTNGGGIKKKRVGGPSPMEGIERQKGRVTKRVVGKKQPTKQGSSGKQSPQQKQKKVAKKPATAEDLDKALDAYMMKDPKTAQAKLDAELTSYMDEAGDILMDENL